jgi:hypothetical protein
LNPLRPVLWWIAVLTMVGLLGAACWLLLRIALPVLRGRGALVLLTAVLVAGAPGLVMDMKKSWASPNGGAYYAISLPASRVQAARWVRDHSAPDDVLATNVHCHRFDGKSRRCDPRSFWLSAYAERRVLVEGWAFAPRLVAAGTSSFWDPDLLRRNDAAITAPTGDGLRGLYRQYHVRWLVVDREIGLEAPTLATLATLRFDNGRMAVYQLR